MSFRPMNRLPTGLPIGPEGYEPPGGWPLQGVPQPGQTIYVPPTQTASGAVLPATFMQMQNGLHGRQVAYPGAMPSFQMGVAPPMYWGQPQQARKPAPSPTPSSSSESSVVTSSSSSSSSACSLPKKKKKKQRRPQSARRSRRDKYSPENSDSDVTEVEKRKSRPEKKALPRDKGKQRERSESRGQIEDKEPRKKARERDESPSRSARPTRREGKGKSKSREMPSCSSTSSNSINQDGEREEQVEEYQGPSSSSKKGPPHTQGETDASGLPVRSMDESRLARREKDLGRDPLPLEYDAREQVRSSQPAQTPSGHTKAGSEESFRQQQSHPIDWSSNGLACPPAPRLVDAMTMSSTSALYPSTKRDWPGDDRNTAGHQASLYQTSRDWPEVSENTRRMRAGAAEIKRPAAPGPTATRPSRMARRDSSSPCQPSGMVVPSPSVFTSSSIAFARIPTVSDGLPPTSQYSNRSRVPKRLPIPRDDTLDDVERVPVGDGRMRIYTILNPASDGEPEILPNFPWVRTRDTVLELRFSDNGSIRKAYLSEAFIMREIPSTIYDMWNRGRTSGRLVQIQIHRHSPIVFDMFYKRLDEGSNVVPLSIGRVGQLQNLCYDMNGPFEILYREALFWGWSSILQHIHDYVNASHRPMRPVSRLPMPTVVPEKKQKLGVSRNEEPTKAASGGDESLTKEEAEALEYYIQSLAGVRSWLELQNGFAYAPPNAMPTPFTGTDWDYGRLVSSTHSRTGEEVAHVRFYDIELNKFLYARIARSEQERCMGDGAVQAVMDWTALREACEEGEASHLDDCLGYKSRKDRTKPRGVQVLFRAEWCLGLIRPKFVVTSMLVTGWWKKGKSRLKSKRRLDWADAVDTEKWTWPLQVALRAGDWNLNDDGEVLLAFYPSKGECYPIPEDGVWMKPNPYV